MSEQVAKSHEVSDDTMQRFQDFIEERATKPDEEVPAEGRVAGEFDINSTGWLIPADGILYERFQYAGEENSPDWQFSVFVGPDHSEIMGMLLVRARKEVVCTFNGGEADMYANDEFVNSTLDTIERLEKEGFITPVAE